MGYHGVLEAKMGTQNGFKIASGSDRKGGQKRGPKKKKRSSKRKLDREAKSTRLSKSRSYTRSPYCGTTLEDRRFYFGGNKSGCGQTISLSSKVLLVAKRDRRFTFISRWNWYHRFDCWRTRQGTLLHSSGGGDKCIIRCIQQQHKPITRQKLVKFSNPRREQVI